MEAEIQYPTYFFFGIAIVLMGCIQFLSRNWQGRYAYQQWKSMGVNRMARSPEFWARASIPVSAIFVVVGLVLVAASFVR